ncbi:MAG: HAD-IB family phosphatase [Solirubrobacteraceae bacterium]|jgi:HAD superfamily phosphoserine phosphatase-like hydrolase
MAASAIRPQAASATLLERRPLMQRRRARRQVEQFLFDLDGTITQREILPAIARAIGLEDEMTALTRQTMDGELPFESSLRRRAEILKAVPVSRVRSIIADVPLDPVILEFLAANRERCTIVTGNLDVWIADLVAHLGVACRCSVARAEGDRLVELVSVLDKATVAREFHGPICAIGDGYNDLGLIAAADIGIAYGGVHAPAPGLIDVATHLIHDPKRLCQLLSAW